MSRVAAISGSRIRFPGESAGKAASRQHSTKGGEKQGVRHRKQALPTPQGWSSGRQAAGEGPGPGQDHSPPRPSSATRPLRLRHQEVEAMPELSRTGQPPGSVPPARAPAAAVSGRRLSAQPTERLGSSISSKSPFRQLPQPISERSSKNAPPITSRTLGPPLVARLDISTAPAPAPVACREFEFHAGVQRPVWGQKPRRKKEQKGEERIAFSYSGQGIFCFLLMETTARVSKGSCPASPHVPRSLS